LSVYVDDVEKKLSVFNEIASKIELLREIINNKFAYSYKQMDFSKERGFIFKTLNKSSLNTETLSPTDLSSGEQHELVLLYELLFKVQPSSLVLIDEPELSLHVGWQTQFLKDLQEITKLADLDILMATHSPDIIQDRWDLTVELKGSDK
jgi:predicted ATP-binding protein involved in virulence